MGRRGSAAGNLSISNRHRMIAPPHSSAVDHAVAPGVDPFEILSHAQEEAAAVMAQTDFLTALLRWLILPDDPREIGLRALTAAHGLRPDLFRDGRLSSMLAPDALARLEQEFEATFATTRPPAGHLGRR